MGKTTLYHPVSLHVIRGAAEYCGWKFGKIKQVGAEKGEGWARYTAEIETVPKRLANDGPMAMLNDLRDCFAVDIEAHWLRQPKTGGWIVDIITRVTVDEESRDN